MSPEPTHIIPLYGAMQKTTRQTLADQAGAAFPPNTPWYNASMMTDNDLAALHVYLTAPVKSHRTKAANPASGANGADCWHE